MNIRRIPLVLALGAAIAGLTSACARDAAPPRADTTAVEQVAHTDAGADVAADDHAGGDVAEQAHVMAAAGKDVPIPGGHVPWTPDAPLIEGMSRVRTALSGLEHEGLARPDEGTVMARAADVDAAISYMFENCVLDPEPDVALHAVLARLMAATRALRADPADIAPVVDMEAAVENYEQLFDDPNAGDNPAP